MVGLDKWNHSEPPKDRWIIMWDEYFDRAELVLLGEYPENFWTRQGYLSSSTFIPNRWMEAPQKPEI